MAMPEPAVAELFDDFVLVPRADSPNFMSALRAIVRRLGVDVVVPTVQEELPIFAAIGDLLGARVVIGPSAGVAIAQDKLFTMWALESAGVSVPDFAAAEDVAAASSAPTRSGGFPLVVKPRTSRGGRGVQVIDDASQWEQIGQAGPGQIVQSFAAGDEYAVQAYVSPVTGDVHTVVLAKTALKQGRVGNAAGVRRSDTDADVAQVAAGAVRALRLVGPVDVDVRRTDDGVPVVLEVNARFGANSAHAPELLDAVLRDYAVPIVATRRPVGSLSAVDNSAGSLDVTRGVA